MEAPLADPSNIIASRGGGTTDQPQKMMEVDGCNKKMTQNGMMTMAIGLKVKMR